MFGLTFCRVLEVTSRNVVSNGVRNVWIIVEDLATIRNMYKGEAL